MSESYGVGKYMGSRTVNVVPDAKVSSPLHMQQVVVVQYADADIIWFEKQVDKELWFHRHMESEDEEVNYVMKQKAWKKKRAKIEMGAQKFAINMIRLKALRNSFHRAPCLPPNQKYRELEKSFQYVLTPDQEQSIRVRGLFLPLYSQVFDATAL